MVDRKIRITVKPNSKKGPLVEPQPDSSFVVYIREIAAEGQANDALIKLLSKHFDVSKTSITIVHGHTSRHKIISIA
ncbi:MAG TPA: DUF167 domain-containing protein [Candidatus Angelobacter sp.]|nr:DUF167 domain-containing protein [Candidatus Angelobacter sp.]